jgi:hypothetical protein
MNVDDDVDARVAYVMRRWSEARETREEGTPLAEALARWGDYSPTICINGEWKIDAIIAWMRGAAEIAAAIDPSFPPALPAHLVDPIFICKLFGIDVNESNCKNDNYIKLHKNMNFISQLAEASLVAGGAVVSPPSTPEEHWYGVADFAAAVKRSEQVIRDWCRKERIRARKRESPGRGGKPEWEIPESELRYYRNHGLRSIQGRGDE